MQYTYFVCNVLILKEISRLSFINAETKWVFLCLIQRFNCKHHDKDQFLKYIV